MIDICVLVYEFQKRFWWMLSSLREQTNQNFIIHPSVHKQDTFYDMNIKIKNNFKVDMREYNEANFGLRGFVRNYDLANCTSEWLLYTDADVVFPKDFFEKLEAKLKVIKNDVGCKVISIPRLTMDIDIGNHLVDSVEYNNPIEDAYLLANKVSTKWSFRGRISGAGYFQLVNIPLLKAAGVERYVNNIKQDSSLMGKREGCSSDIAFRTKLGGVYPVNDLPPIIHINHYRKKFNPDMFKEPLCR